MSILRFFLAFPLAILAAASLRTIRDYYLWYTREPYDFYKSKDYYVWTSPNSGWNARARELPQSTRIDESDLVCAAGVQGMGGQSFISAFFEPGIVFRRNGKILQLADEDAAGFRMLAESVRALPQIHQRDHFAIDHGDTSCLSSHSIYLAYPERERKVQVPMEKPETRTGGFEVLEVFDPKDGPREMRQSEHGVSISVHGFYKHYRRMYDGEDLPQCLWELLGLLEETGRTCTADGGSVDYGHPSNLRQRMKKWEGMFGIAGGFEDFEEMW